MQEFYRKRLHPRTRSTGFYALSITAKIEIRYISLGGEAFEKHVKKTLSQRIGRLVADERAHPESPWNDCAS